MTDQVTIPMTDRVTDRVTEAVTDPVAEAVTDPVAGPESGLKVVVEGRREAAQGVVELSLVSPDGGPLPRWSPGAHIDVRLTPSLTRQYSLCGDPSGPARWRIGVLREPNGRGGSAYLHDEVRPGMVLEVSAPRNNFALAPANRYLFVAGGIGITPLLPMIAEAEAKGVRWSLLYGGRTRASMAFTDELAGYGGPGKVRLCPQDECGLLDLETYLAEIDDQALIYACGPEPMLRAVTTASGHWPAGALHVERFSPVEVAEPARKEAFTVVLARSGLTLEVLPGRSILETVEAAGVNVLSSCREGTCGTCETDVLAGRPDHRDSLLTEAERAAGETMFICVSRSRDPELTLDL